ncbi:FadR/GntR family transcriptional regulator [soil metagenome]
MAELQDEISRNRNGGDGDAEDPQIIASRGAHSIVSRLRRAIETGVYTDGDQLPPERQLAVAFGTARSTIRKALDQLEQKSLVVRRVGSGTFVNYAGPVHDALSDVTDLISPLQLIEARLAIEPSMTRLAALHASSRDLDQIETILRHLDDAKQDQDEFSRLDSELHLQLARCSRNPLLYRLYQQVNTVRNHAQWEQMKQIILSPEKMALYNQQHRTIFEALKQRDVTGAGELIIKHLELARQDLVGADSI